MRRALVSLRMTVRRKRISSWSVVLLLALAAPAVAAEIVEPPVVTSEHSPPGVFSDLEASPGVWSPEAAEASYQWLRCDAGGDDCTPIDFACSRSYTTSEGDVGNTLRIRLTVAEAGGATASATSAQTALVEARVYDIPSEAPTDTCTKLNPTGPKTGSFDSGTEAQPQPQPVTVPGQGLTQFIRPFPVVRVAGRFTRRYTKITLVSVRAPRGVRIGVACRGRSCKFHRRAMAARVRRVRSLQRRYRPGTVLEIRVTQADRIGKYMRMRIRSGRAPLRIDRCVLPGKGKAVRCPAA